MAGLTVFLQQLRHLPGCQVVRTVGACTCGLHELQDVLDNYDELVRVNGPFQLMIDPDACCAACGAPYWNHPHPDAFCARFVPGGV